MKFRKWRNWLNATPQVGVKMRFDSVDRMVQLVVGSSPTLLNDMIVH